MELTTPALLFPAISLLFLAYTNRFMSMAALVRELHGRYLSHPDPVLRGQLVNLRFRLGLIRDMQIVGVLSFLCMVLCMFLLFAGRPDLGQAVFGIGLVLLLASLGLALREILVSIEALRLQLRDLDELS